MDNLQPFYIGQKVEYITGKNMPKGTKDIVTACYKSDCYCECWKIQVKTHSSKTNGSETTCGNCGDLRTADGGWTASSWKPLKEDKFPLISYSKVLEEELVGAN